MHTDFEQRSTFPGRPVSWSGNGAIVHAGVVGVR